MRVRKLTFVCWLWEGLGGGEEEQSAPNDNPEPVLAMCLPCLQVFHTCVVSFDSHTKHTTPCSRLYTRQLQRKREFRARPQGHPAKK